jgi:putative DNA primase/helicase
VLENILRITGEDLLSVNRKHKPALPSVRIHARIVVATNETPKLNDSSGAIASRFIILKMEKSFLDAEDTGLSDRLIAGLPGVLNWAIAGRQRLLERGKFIQPSSAADAVQQLADASSAVGVFLRDCAVIGDGKTASVTDAWNAWNWWCEQQGRNHPGDQSYLGRELRTVIPTLTTPQPRGDDGKQHRVFDGFTLTAEAKAAGTEWFERQQLEMEAKKRRNRDTILRY